MRIFKPSMAVALISVGALVSACSGTSSGATGKSNPTISVGYFSGGVGAPETIIGSDPALEKTISAHLRFTPITAGLQALSEMRASAFGIVSEVGNPPVVSSVAGGTNLRVIWVQSFDGAGLIVHSGITSPQQLKGFTIGDLQGSSEDFELRGFLKENGLTNQVKVVGFPSDAAVGAAWISGHIQAAYTTIDIEDELLHKGGHQMVTATQIAKAGYPSLNVLVAAQSLISSHPASVQAYVCAEMKATSILTTAPKGVRDSRIAAGAKLQGVPVTEAITATEQWPNIPVSQEKSWLVPAPGQSANPVTKAYELTASFLKNQGVLASPPSDQVLAGLVDAKFALNALAGKC
ncbi:MAG: ABC transporter substrate-binding protein [Streptosporangiaceae bacterium]